MAAALRPGASYFEHLRDVLKALHGLRLSWSLSGLECTDDPDWLLALLDTLKSGQAEESVMYTNGAGFADDGHRLLPALSHFGLSWLEWSRHHDQQAQNQHIMRFRASVKMAAQPVFEKALKNALGQIPVRLVCVVQRGGIETRADVLRYVSWAHSLGVRTVIFREFSELPENYQHNATRRYIDDSRIAIDALLQDCMEDAAFRRSYSPVALTGGYYFWNARWQDADTREVIFEKSDYRAMLEREAGTPEGLIYKLVFHANGNLCSGWQPGRHVLWSPREQQ